MGSWLRNLQGQLTELASEVLNEATTEVADPGSELQVAKKKMDELERELAGVSAARDEAVAHCEILTEQLEDAQRREQSLRMRSTTAIEQRDQQIRSLQMEVEKHHTRTRFASSDEDWPVSPGDSDFSRMEDDLRQLRSEVAHWRRVVQESDASKQQVEVTELRANIAQLINKHQDEIAALQHAHAETIRQLKEHFESRDKETSWDDFDVEKAPGDNAELCARLSQLQTDKETLIREKDDLREQLVEARSALELRSTASNVHDDAVQVEEGRVTILEQEVAQLRASLRAEEEETRTAREVVESLQGEIHQLRESTREKEQKWEARLHEAENLEEHEHLRQEVQRLSAENAEFSSAYNDLNDELEKHKTDYGSVLTSNRDLATRIESLKADLIEYEEKYEVCKAENAETVRHLEKLTASFDKLKSGFENAKSHNRHCDEAITDEVERLRVALHSSKEDRDRLRADVDTFRGTIEAIDRELESLREGNRRLASENHALIDAVGKLEQVKVALEESGKEMNILREQFAEMQREHEEKESALSSQLEQAMTRIAELSRMGDDALARADAAEAALDRYRSVVGDERAAILEMTKETKKSGGSSSSDNNGWDKMTEWEAGGETPIADRGDDGDLARLTGRVSDEQQHKIEELQREIGELHEQVEIGRAMLREGGERREEERVAFEKAIASAQAEKDEVLATMAEVRTARDRCEETLRTVESERDRLQAELSSMRIALDEAKSRVEVVDANADDLSRLRARIDELESRVRELQAEKDEFESAVHAKHEESVKFHGIAQAALEEKNLQQEQVRAIIEEREHLREKMEQLTAEREKAQRESARLREHLIAMEEANAAEAIAVEQRETELRTRLRYLEGIAEDAENTVSASSATHEWEMSELVRRCVDAESARADLESQLAITTGELVESRRALASLQLVLRDLSREQESQMQAINEQLAQSKQRIETLTGEIDTRCGQIAQLEDALRLAGDETATIKSALAEREQLLVQLEAEQRERAPTGGSKDPHLDPGVLRQLFLSYFTAEADKRHDIAMLLASVLGFPPEDLAKIPNDTARGWFALRQRGGPTFSITEQFIRFLESESALATRTPLPVQAPVNAPLRPGELRPQSRHSSPISDDLRSILDT